MNAKVRRFALREHWSWQIRHWRPVLFTDERRFPLSTCDRPERVCKQCETLVLLPGTSWFEWVPLMVWKGVRILGGSQRYPGPVQRYPACGWVTGWAFFGPLPGSGCLRGFLLPGVVRVCHHFLDDKGINAIYLNIMYGCIMPSSMSGRRSSDRSTRRTDYDEYTVMNPVLNWIMICVFTVDSYTFLY